jgi:hypothetical protein
VTKYEIVWPGGGVITLFDSMTAAQIFALESGLTDFEVNPVAVEDEPDHVVKIADYPDCLKFNLAPGE